MFAIVVEPVFDVFKKNIFFSGEHVPFVTYQGLLYIELSVFFFLVGTSANNPGSAALVFGCVRFTALDWAFEILRNFRAFL